ncbi:hypothetical protein Golob_020199, partial [Gossypium lobatum]|nr:hypothetical protein [Gossypium lobatum]
MQSWTLAFSTDQVQPKSLMVWIMLPGLPGGICTKSLLQFIGSVIGLVVKIDRNIDNSSRGKFSRLAVYVDLGKPLVSKVKNDGKTQRVEYESLPMVCFDCGRFGHNREFCPHKSMGKLNVSSMNPYLWFVSLREIWAQLRVFFAQIWS